MDRTPRFPATPRYSSALRRDLVTIASALFLMTSEEQYRPLIGQQASVVIWGKSKNEEIYDGTVESLSDRFLLLKLGADSESAERGERILVRYCEIKRVLQYA